MDLTPLVHIGSNNSREPHARLLRWYRDLLRARRERPELRDGDLTSVDVTWDAASRRFASRRGGAARQGPATLGNAGPRRDTPSRAADGH